DKSAETKENAPAGQEKENETAGTDISQASVSQPVTKAPAHEAGQGPRNQGSGVNPPNVKTEAVTQTGNGERAREEASRKNLIRTAGISIKDALGGVGNDNDPSDPAEEEETDEPELDNDLSETPFSQDELLSKWKAYAESIREERPRLSITLASRQPVLKDEFKIDVVLDNAAQLEDFNLNLKADLHRYLRYQLKNALVQIMPRLAENEMVKKKIYTTEDKFQYMSKKNPNLTKLKQQFNLDLE
ncbi:MAG TPA: hypothetical protein VE870_09120, partial [Bacteroidales bacterium]|nr:hypothetical protein [Bacteroidales bacterium]